VVVTLSGAFTQAQDNPSRLIWQEARSLMEAGRYGEAVPLLERLHGRMPDESGITFELAHAYFQLSRDRDAGRLFRKARAQATLLSDRAVADAYLKALAARRPWQFQLSGGILPFASASRRKSDDYVTLAGVEFRLNKPEKSGPGLGLSFGARYRSHLAGPWYQTVSTGLSGEIFSNSYWNDYTAFAETGIAYRPDVHSEYASGLTYRHRWVSDSPYRAEYGPYFSYARSLSGNSVLLLRTDILKREDMNAGRRSSDIYKGRLHLSHQLSSAVSLNGGLAYEGIRSPLRHEAGNILSLRSGLDYRFERSRLSLNLRHLIERRQDKDPVFRLQRFDRESGISVGFSNERWEFNGLSAEIEFGAERRKSNISLYSWRGNYISVSFGKKF